GNDTLIGGRGNDTMLGGDGDDVFIWNPGDGSDTIEGQGGHDTMGFNGANIAEVIDLSANSSRLRFTRNVANIVMDCNGIEQVDFTARGGADQITVNDLTGTGVTSINLDLAGTPGSGAGDGAADTVIVTGTSGNDNITISGSGGSVSVAGLPWQVNITGSEPALDRLTINAGSGDDIVNASALQATSIGLTINGEDGNDQLTGSQGDDTLDGGPGNDLLIGGRGNDTMRGGDGDDVFIWNPGDGSDIVEGEAGHDTLLFN